MDLPKPTVVTSLFLLAIAISLLATWSLLSKTGVQISGLAVNPTGTVSASVQGSVDIFLQVATVNFGAVQVGVSYNGASSCNYSNASQFLLRNDGSVRVNVTIQSTALWTSISQTAGSSAYLWNVTNTTGNTSLPELCATSPNAWNNMRLSGDDPLGEEICYLNFTDANDYAKISIYITVPSGEAAGAKTSTVTFTGSQA